MYLFQIWLDYDFVSGFYIKCQFSYRMSADFGLHCRRRLCDSHPHKSRPVVYQNPEDFPPGGFFTLMHARTPDLSSSSAKSFE